MINWTTKQWITKRVFLWGHVRYKTRTTVSQQSYSCARIWKTSRRTGGWVCIRRTVECQPPMYAFISSMKWKMAKTSYMSMNTTMYSANSGKSTDIQARIAYAFVQERFVF